MQVKNFGNEGVESGKFGTAIDKYQAAEYTMVMSFNVVGLLQGTIVFSATVLGLVLCIKVCCPEERRKTWQSGSLCSV